MTVTINVDRGEVGLSLSGTVYPMLPTFAAVNAIEARLGSVLTLAARAAYGGERMLTFSEMGVVAAECVKAAGKDRSNAMYTGVSAEKFAELIYENGFTDELAKAIGEILANMVTGGAKKKETAAVQEQSA